MNQQDKMQLQWIYDLLEMVHCEAETEDHMKRLQQIINTPDDQEGMLTAFRHAANSIALEAGVIASHKAHGGISGDHYFLELIRESELRIKRLSLRYEKLRAAARAATEPGMPAVQLMIAVDELREELDDES